MRCIARFSCKYSFSMTETTSDTTNNTSTQIFTDTRIHRIPQSRILLAFSIFYAKQETKFSCEVRGWCEPHTHNTFKHLGIQQRRQQYSSSSISSATTYLCTRSAFLLKIEAFNPYTTYRQAYSKLTVIGQCLGFV